jgi:serine/threonine protein kinase
MAPEIINNTYYGISVDIWALGVLFYFMLFAEYPFKGIVFYINKVMT